MINAVVLVATGVNHNGYREVLGVRVATSETREAWNVFFADLVAAALHGVMLVTSDARAGLVEAVAANLPGASWQRCRTRPAHRFSDSPDMSGRFTWVGWTGLGVGGDDVPVTGCGWRWWRVVVVAVTVLAVVGLGLPGAVFVTGWATQGAPAGVLALADLPDPVSGQVNMLSRWYDPGEAQSASRGSAGLSPVPNSVSANRYAAGSMAEAAVHAYLDGKQLTLADRGGAALTGAVGGAIGGAGGAILGKAVTAVGAKLAGPITKLLGRATQEGEEEATQAASKAATEGAEDESGASCPWSANSFAPDTKVLLASGKTIPIAALTVGDKVTATDTTTGKHHTRAVAAVMVNHDTDLFDVTVRHAGTTATLHTTSGHPFWAANRHAWVRADQLTTTDTLTSTNGDTVTVAHTQAAPGAADRWDLTIDTDHDFYVSAGDEAVLVHNCPTGTVWDHVKATQENYSGTPLPRSFTLSTEKGDVWVHGNATEHIAERLQSMAAHGADGQSIELAAQIHLENLRAAVSEALQNDVPFGQDVEAGGIELGFRPPRADGLLPALIRALPKG